MGGREEEGGEVGGREEKGEVGEAICHHRNPLRETPFQPPLRDPAPPAGIKDCWAFWSHAPPPSCPSPSSLPIPCRPSPPLSPSLRKRGGGRVCVEEGMRKERAGCIGGEPCKASPPPSTRTQSHDCNLSHDGYERGGGRTVIGSRQTEREQRREILRKQHFFPSLYLLVTGRGKDEARQAH